MIADQICCYHRYALLVEDNVVKAYSEEENPGVAECSMAAPVLELLKKM